MLLENCRSAIPLNGLNLASGSLLKHRTQLSHLWFEILPSCGLRPELLVMRWLHPVPKTAMISSLSLKQYDNNSFLDSRPYLLYLSFEINGNLLASVKKASWSFDVLELGDATSRSKQRDLLEFQWWSRMYCLWTQASFGFLSVWFYCIDCAIGFLLSSIKKLCGFLLPTAAMRWWRRWKNDGTKLAVLGSLDTINAYRIGRIGVKMSRVTSYSIICLSFKKHV